MAIIREYSKVLKSVALRPVPKVKKPKLTMKELELFPEYAD